MKLLIEYQSRKKAIECEPNELIEKVETLFDLKNKSFVLEVYDSDFKDYVEIDDISKLEPLSKIRVKLIDQLANTLISMKKSSCFDFLVLIEFILF